MMLRNIFGCRSLSSYTIFNKSSGSGKCGVAVIRVSGDRTKEVLRSTTGTDSYKPRYANYRKIKDPITNEVIDNGLVIYFQAPKSFTGEESCEFQIHGGNAVISALLNALGKIKGLRLSEPGEFSKRAFLNGKMDILEAEGIADLIHAETELQRKQALIQAEGHLSKLYQRWRTKLIRNIAHIEAFIDFSEDDNIEDNVLSTVQRELVHLKKEIKDHLLDGRKGERLRDGVRMAIIGSTNVGKSSLMNLIVQRDVSIVTDIEGTTRDIIESTFEINGYPVVIMDTAGLRHSTDIVESEGIKRAIKCTSQADLIILMIDGFKLEKEFCGKSIDLGTYKSIYLKRLGLNDEIINDKKILTVVNKIDLMSDEVKEEIENSGVISVSCTRNYKIHDLINEITKYLGELCGNPSAECPMLTQVRHRYYLEECLQNLSSFLEQYNPNEEQDLAILVQSIRNSVRSIGKITGEVRIDDILDVIFKDFCIGK